MFNIMIALLPFLSHLNNDLGGNRFGFTTDGLPGYKKAGADTVYPFSGSRSDSVAYNSNRGGWVIDFGLPIKYVTFVDPGITNFSWGGVYIYNGSSFRGMTAQLAGWSARPAYKIIGTAFIVTDLPGIADFGKVNLQYYAGL